MIEIDKNIPVPKINSKFPFDKMEVGDSFFTDTLNVSSNAYGWAKKYSNNKIKFKQRKEGNGMILWRTA